MIPGSPEGQRMASRHAIGWMNNWDYARKLPTRTGRAAPIQ